MIRIVCTAVLALAIPLTVHAMDPMPPPVQCGDPARPLLSVADFDGSGRVDGNDIARLARAIHDGQYYAFYDRNADRLLDHRDLRAATGDLHRESNAFDRELAAAFARFHHFQTINQPAPLVQLGFTPGTPPLRGHGVHWLSPAGIASTQGLKHADRTLAEGLNVPGDGRGVWGMFWGEPAVPLFEDPSSDTGLGPLDYPTPGGAWENKPVQAFGDMPPTLFGSADEHWHSHAGLCSVVEDHGQGPQVMVYQHMTFAACQALPSLAPTGILHPNAWMNFRMIHLWLFELNPNGVFGATHPCLDPGAPPEEFFNGDRPVPPYFQMH